jgi:hypothetical protein
MMNHRFNGLGPLACVVFAAWSAASWAAPPVASGTAAAAAPPAVNCKAASADQLKGLAAAGEPASLLAQSDTVPAGAPADLVMVAPPKTNLPATDLQFWVLIQPPQAPPGSLPTALGPLPAQRPSDDQAKKFGITAPQNAVVVRTNIPAEPFRILPVWRTYGVSVVGCSSDPKAPSVATPVRQILVSNHGAALFWAWALVVVLYVFAATCVYLDRVRAVKESSGAHAVAPVRLSPIRKWSWFKCLNPIILTSDMFDRGNLSQFQILFFAGIVIFGLVDLTLSTRSLSDLSPAIVYLLGLPAAGTLGTQLANAQRDRLSVDNWSWLVSRGVLPLNDPGISEPRWTDLVMQDSELDLSKLQALGFSIIVGGAMIVEGFSTLSTFTIPSALLQILGLSQLVFVGGRFTKPASMAELDDLITTLRVRYDALRQAALTGVDVTLTGEPGTAAALAGAPFRSFADARAAIKNAAQRYTDVANQVKALLDSLSHRSVDKTKIDTPDL